MAHTRSEAELRRDLDEPRSGRADDLPERTAPNVSLHGACPVELRVVEHVERLDAHLERLGAAERHVLDERHVETHDARTVEETARRIAQLTQRRQTEARRVERWPLRRIVVDTCIAVDRES